MFAIIGIVVVFGCVVGGYLMEHGNLSVLLQPAELVTIGGAAVGTVLIANPLHILKQIAGGIGGVFGGSTYNKQAYIDSLKMMYDLLNKARKDGLMALEDDVEEPDKSPLLSKAPKVFKNHHVRDFVCDSLRMAITGVDAFDLDQMLDLDLEVHHHDAEQPTAALTSVADSLPGLGIVAAVLGIVITMGAMGGPPEEIGRKVAAALVGTFLGILLVLWAGRADRGQHGKARRRRTCLSVRAAGPDRVFSKGHRADHGGGSGTARHSRSRATLVPGSRGRLPQQGRWGRSCGGRGGGGGGGAFWIDEFSAQVMDKTRPIIILKKKGGHGGHHGGAWKVAYADFVTAMMSLFIVLWLLSSSKPVQEAVGGYFRDPNGTASQKGSAVAGAGENFVLTKDNMPKLKDQLEQKIREMNDFEKLKNHIEMTVTNEGLRIELMESASGTFFDSRQF